MPFHTRDRRGRQPVIIYADNSHKVASLDRLAKPWRRAPLLLLLGVVSLFLLQPASGINGCRPSACPSDKDCPTGCDNCMRKNSKPTCVAVDSFTKNKCVLWTDGCAYSGTYVESRVQSNCFGLTKKLTCARFCNWNSATCNACTDGYYLSTGDSCLSDAECSSPGDYCVSTGKCGQCLAWYVNLTCVRESQRCSPLELWFPGPSFKRTRA